MIKAGIGLGGVFCARIDVDRVGLRIVPEADASIVTCTTPKPGRVDRSPCGTGSLANLAFLQAPGQREVGDRRISRSAPRGVPCTSTL